MIETRVPRQSPAKAIAREAEKIFEGLLRSDEWLDIRIHQEYDYGLDYRIEAIEDGELRGFEFYVQLKGTGTISEPRDLSITVKCSTVRYWKLKVLPVLIVVVGCSDRRAFFAWFDKSTEVPIDQQTMTLRLQGVEELTGKLLRHSIEPYFRMLNQALGDANTRSLLLKLSSDTMIMSSVLMDTNLRMRNLSGSDLAPSLHTLYFYFDCLSTFLKHLDLYTRHAPMAWRSVHEHIGPSIQALREQHRAMYFKSTRSGATEVFEGRLEDVADSLPVVTKLFSELSRFLGSRVHADMKAEP